MNSHFKRPSGEPTPEQLAVALDLLAEAQRLDHLATLALMKAEAAFKAIGKPLPLFDSLATAHQRETTRLSRDDEEGR